MKTILHKTIRHPLITGSIIVFSGSMVVNVLGYLFNLAMGRLLVATDYGVLASLMSIVGIFSVFSTTVTTMFTKLAASFAAEDKSEHISVLVSKGTLWIGCMNILMLAIFLSCSSFIAQFLHIGDWRLISLTFLVLFFSLLIAIPAGVLQGLLQFVSLSIVNIVLMVIKLVLGIVLVFIGYSLYGALFAMLFANVFGYGIFLGVLYTRIRKQVQKNVTINIYKDMLLPVFPVFLASLGITLFSTLDVILVKHYLSPVAAGQYAALSLMGKSIFYAVGPIIAVFFPLITQKRAKNESVVSTLLLALVLICVPAVCLSVIYFVWPMLVIHIFFPAPIYQGLSAYIGLFSIFVLFYTIISLFNSLYLSYTRTKVYIFTLVGSFLQIVTISLFHQNIMQIVLGLIGISLLLLIALLVYYPYMHTVARYTKS